MGALRVSWDVLELHIPRRDKIRGLVSWRASTSRVTTHPSPLFFRNDLLILVDDI
jgi:hypothetical protein